MTLMTKPQSLRGIRKKTRVILEKFKDLSNQRKFERTTSRNSIAKRNGKTADVQVCIHYILESYKCFLSIQFDYTDYPKNKQAILFNNLKTLEIKVLASVQNNNPIPHKYISNVLKAHTIYFNSLKSKKINKDCSEPYEKLVLSAISVWNNEWN